jgi:hypothetical protein
VNEAFVSVICDSARRYQKPVVGLIVGWLPPTPLEEALWHVQHLDGDEEDLDEGEVLESLVPLGAEEAVQEGLQRDTAMDVVDLEDEDQGKSAGAVGSKSLSSASLARNASAMSLGAASTSSAKAGKSSTATRPVVDYDNDSEAEFEEKIQPVARVLVPDIIRLASGLVPRGTPIWRAPPLTNAVGVQALRLELTRLLGLLNDELKRMGGGFSREGRKVWEHSVRDADTVADLRSPLMELEALVRDLQTADDKRDAEEVRLAKEAERKEMAAEGWLFDASANELIGVQARRFFKGFGKSDGTVVAYLPPEKNDSVALYHMEHNDGDSEDLELHDLQKALRCFEQDLQEDDEVENPDSDGEDSDSDESSQSSEMSEDDDELHTPSGGAGATLWPTYEVRQRWLAALNNSQTVGEVGLALLAFLEQAQAFGALAKDPAAEAQHLKPRQARLALKPSAYKESAYRDDSSQDSPVQVRRSTRDRAPVENYRPESPSVTPVRRNPRDRGQAQSNRGDSPEPPIRRSTRDRAPVEVYHPESPAEAPIRRSTRDRAPVETYHPESPPDSPVRRSSRDRERSSNLQYEERRPVRSAARAVKSYAE